MTMNSTIIAVFAIMVGAALSAEPAVDLSLLLKVPCLSPQLTSDEVSKAFTPWAEQVRKTSSKLKPYFALAYSGARISLSSKLPQVTAITLYSLSPIDAANIRHLEPKRAKELEKLERFHDYPILGRLRIEDAVQANQWVDFLRDQILPGGTFLCDFMPRHGFRLSTADGDIDILMCYSCDQLLFFGAARLDNKHNPVFSSATKAQLNQLFDKLKIKRDQPSDDKD